LNALRFHWQPKCAVSSNSLPSRCAWRRMASRGLDAVGIAAKLAGIDDTAGRA
jgi:hypothetical protein